MKRVLSGRKSPVSEVNTTVEDSKIPSALIIEKLEPAVLKAFSMGDGRFKQRHPGYSLALPI